MSGKRQHFIPQFLQQGFKSHTQTGESYTWVYRKHSEPFNSNLINVGVQKYFYTEKGGASEADDLITDAENPFSDLVQNLRAHPFGKIEILTIPQLIAHLEIRTRHLRQNFVRIGDILFNEVFSFLNDDEAFLKYAKKELKDENSQLHKDAVKEFKKNGFPKSLVKKLIRQNTDSLINELRPYLSLAVDQMQNQVNKEDLEKEIKNIHINIFKQTVAPDVRVSFYKKLEYFLIEVEEANLIQGDSAILFKTSESYKTFVDKTDKIHAMLLPLTPKKLLLGKAAGFKVNPNQLVEIIAKNSLEYFISSEERSDLKILQQQIGEEAHILTRKEIENVVRETFRI